MEESSKEYEGVWVYLEQAKGVFENVSLELLGKGRELADRLQTELTGVILGKDVGRLASEAASLGADNVLVADHELLENYTTEAYSKTIAQLVNERKPSVLLFGATHNGRDLAGRLAVRLKTGLTANVVRLEIEKKTNLLLSYVPGFGGKIYAVCKCEKSRPQMATARPGIFKKPNPNTSKKGSIQSIPVTIGPEEIRAQVLEKVVDEKTDITQARTIVIGGLGTGGNLNVIKELASSLHGEIGVTRPIADRMIVSRDYQIGSTGYSVRPRLAIVVGASGAAHFVSGIDEAEVVVSINNDKEAPIFEYSDYCVVDDLFKFVPALTAELTGSKKGGIAT